MESAPVTDERAGVENGTERDSIWLVWDESERGVYFEAEFEYIDDHLVSENYHPYYYSGLFDSLERDALQNDLEQLGAFIEPMQGVENYFRVYDNDTVYAYKSLDYLAADLDELAAKGYIQVTETDNLELKHLPSLRENVDLLTSQGWEETTQPRSADID